MEITKRYCDICGKEITNGIYRHLVMPIYLVNTPTCKYVKDKEIDVCDDCGIMLTEFIYEKQNEYKELKENEEINEN